MGCSHLGGWLDKVPGTMQGLCRGDAGEVRCCKGRCLILVWCGVAVCRAALSMLAVWRRAVPLSLSLSLSLSHLSGSSSWLDSA